MQKKRKNQKSSVCPDCGQKQEGGDIVCYACGADLKIDEDNDKYKRNSGTGQEN